MDQLTKKSDSLTRLGKSIGKIHAAVYVLIFLLLTHQTVKHSKCYLPLAYFGCIVYLIGLLIMALASGALIHGIKTQRPAELTIWLILTAFMQIVDVTILFFVEQNLFIMISIILALSLISWLTILKLYQRLTMECEQRKARILEGKRLLGNTANTVVRTKISYEPNRGKPPSYNDAVTDI